MKLNDTYCNNWGGKMIKKANKYLKDTEIYQILEEKCKMTEDYEVLTIVNDVYEYSINKLKAVIKNLPEFTLHDEVHIFNMLTIVGKLISKDQLSSLSIPDLMMSILSISLHDIGMAPDELTIKAWKCVLTEADLNDELLNEQKEFLRFRKTQINLTNEIEVLNNNNENSKAQILEDFIISSYIRTTHSIRAKKIISSDWKDKIKYRETDLTPYLAQICHSHDQDYQIILNMETFCLCDDDVYLCIPFVAVLLRLIDIIDFDPKRTPKILFSHLTVSNPVSLREWNKHLSINAWTISEKKLIYSAQCSHPAIESAINQFCDLIDSELRNSTLIISNLNGDDFDLNVDIYKIKLPARVTRNKIQAKIDIITGKPLYRYNNTKFALSKNQVIDLLMGTKLYGKSEVALRELIQNSIDACLLRSKLHETWEESYTPEIIVKLEKVDGIDYLEVSDNGIGMNQYIIDNYYSNIGSSYYKSNDFYELIGNLKTSFTPISRFGIGILACFMISDHLEVNTRRIVDQYGCDEALQLNIEGYDSLFVITDSQKKAPGTITKLKLRKQNPWERINEDKFIESVKRIVPNPPFDIVIKTQKCEEKHTLQNSNFLDLSPIKDYSWDGMDNVSVFRLDIDNHHLGFRGICDVAIITSKNKVIDRINITSKVVEVDGEEYTLSTDVNYGSNCIEKISDTLSVNEDDEVQVDSSHNRSFNSKR